MWEDIIYFFSNFGIQTSPIGSNDALSNVVNNVTWATASWLPAQDTSALEDLMNSDNPIFDDADEIFDDPPSIDLVDWFDSLFGDLKTYLILGIIILVLLMIVF